VQVLIRKIFGERHTGFAYNSATTWEDALILLYDSRIEHYETPRSVLIK